MQFDDKPNDIVYVIPKDMGIFINKIDEINPVFRLISNALTPFLTVRALVHRDGGVRFDPTLIFIRENPYSSFRSSLRIFSMGKSPVDNWNH